MGNSLPGKVNPSHNAGAFPLPVDKALGNLKLAGQLWRSCDQDHDGLLDRAELTRFVELLSEQLGQPLSRDQINLGVAAIFDAFDPDRQGRIGFGALFGVRLELASATSTPPQPIPSARPQAPAVDGRQSRSLASAVTAGTIPDSPRQPQHRQSLPLGSAAPFLLSSSFSEASAAAAEPHQSDCHSVGHAGGLAELGSTVGRRSHRPEGQTVDRMPHPQARSLPASPRSLLTAAGGNRGPYLGQGGAPAGGGGAGAGPATRAAPSTPGLSQRLMRLLRGEPWSQDAAWSNSPPGGASSPPLQQQAEYDIERLLNNPRQLKRAGRAGFPPHQRAQIWLALARRSLQGKNAIATGSSFPSMLGGNGGSNRPDKPVASYERLVTLLFPETGGHLPSYFPPSLVPLFGSTASWTQLRDRGGQVSIASTTVMRVRRRRERLEVQRRRRQRRLLEKAQRREQESSAAPSPLPVPAPDGRNPGAVPGAPLGDSVAPHVVPEPPSSLPADTCGGVAQPHSSQQRQVQRRLELDIGCDADILPVAPQPAWSAQTTPMAAANSDDRELSLERSHSEGDEPRDVATGAAALPPPSGLRKPPRRASCASSGGSQKRFDYHLPQEDPEGDPAAGCSAVSRGDASSASDGERGGDGDGDGNGIGDGSRFEAESLCSKSGSGDGGSGEEEYEEELPMLRVDHEHVVTPSVLNEVKEILCVLGSEFPSMRFAPPLVDLLMFLLIPEHSEHWGCVEPDHDHDYPRGFVRLGPDSVCCPELPFAEEYLLESSIQEHSSGAPAAGSRPRRAVSSATPSARGGGPGLPATAADHGSHNSGASSGGPSASMTAAEPSGAPQRLPLTVQRPPAQSEMLLHNVVLPTGAPVVPSPPAGSQGSPVQAGSLLGAATASLPAGALSQPQRLRLMPGIPGSPPQPSQRKPRSRSVVATAPVGEQDSLRRFHAHREHWRRENQLHHFNRDEAYYIARSMCELETRWSFPSHHHTEFVRHCHTFGALLKQHLPLVENHLTAIVGMDVREELFKPWYSTLFIPYLPPVMVQRILDSFFVEGHKIMFRYGLAVCRHFRQQILESHTAEEVLNRLEYGMHCCDDPASVEALTRLAFQFNLRRKHMAQLDNAPAESALISCQLPPRERSRGASRPGGAAGAAEAILGVKPSSKACSTDSSDNGEPPSQPESRLHRHKQRLRLQQQGAVFHLPRMGVPPRAVLLAKGIQPPLGQPAQQPGVPSQSLAVTADDLEAAARAAAEAAIELQRQQDEEDRRRQAQLSALEEHKRYEQLAAAASGSPSGGLRPYRTLMNHERLLWGWSWLPANLRLRHPRLLFSTLALGDPLRLSALLDRFEDDQGLEALPLDAWGRVATDQQEVASIMLVQDIQHNVFGVFSEFSWRRAHPSGSAAAATQAGVLQSSPGLGRMRRNDGPATSWTKGYRRGQLRSHRRGLFVFQFRPSPEDNEAVRMAAAAAQVPGSDKGPGGLELDLDLHPEPQCAGNLSYHIGDGVEMAAASGASLSLDPELAMATGSSATCDTGSDTSRGTSSSTQGLNPVELRDGGLVLVRCDDDVLSVGDRSGQALELHHTLEHGFTQPTLVFGNPSLSPAAREGGKFDVLHLEVWTLLG